MSGIYFHIEDISFLLNNHSQISQWIHRTVKDQSMEIININYIFCSDDYLLGINQEHLQHDYYTDIITFDFADNPNQLEGDIYISIERIRENATLESVDFTDELHRVMIHGILHLCGVNDKTVAEKAAMRKLENHYLALRINHNTE